MPCKKASAQELSFESVCPLIDRRSVAASRSPAKNLERGQVSRDIRRLKCGPGERSDGAERAGVFISIASQRRVIEIRPEHGLCGLERLGAESGLAPAGHLRVEPGGLNGIGPRRALARDQEIAAALAH